MSNITFMGTGGAFNLIHGNTSAIFNFNDTNLLIDCGHTVPRYIEQKMPVVNINNIFITHMHGDHIGGLEELGFRNRYIHNGKKPNLFIHVEIVDRLKEYIEATMKFTAEGICGLGDYFNVFVVDKSFTINSYRFEIEQTQHIPIAKSYMLKGNNFIYTGDTSFIDWTKRDLDRIDFIFQDTSLHKYSDNDVHASLPDLLTLPEDIRKKIYCMHYGNDIDNFKETIENSKMHIVNVYENIILE